MDGAREQAKAGEDSGCLRWRAGPVEFGDRASVPEVFDGGYKSKGDETAVAREGGGPGNGNHGEFDVYSFPLPLEPARETPIDDVPDLGVEPLGRSVGEYDLGELFRDRLTGGEEGFTLGGGNQFYGDDPRRGVTFQLQGGGDVSGARDNKADGGFGGHGLEPIGVVTSAAHGADFPVSGFFYQLIDHAADDAELEAEQYHHGGEDGGKGEDETSRHDPFMDVVPKGKP